MVEDSPSRNVLLWGPETGGKVSLGFVVPDALAAGPSPLAGGGRARAGIQVDRQIRTFDHHIEPSRLF